jgi:hypothetical protein
MPRIRHLGYVPPALREEAIRERLRGPRALRPESVRERLRGRSSSATEGYRFLEALSALLASNR